MDLSTYWTCPFCWSEFVLHVEYASAFYPDINYPCTSDSVSKPISHLGIIGNPPSPPPKHPVQIWLKSSFSIPAATNLFDGIDVGRVFATVNHLSHT